MKKFHTLKIREVHEETPDAVSVTFEVPDDLKETFRYRQGQHLTLRKQIDGEDLRRSYSICASVAEDDLRIAVRELPEGRFSGWIRRHLKAGDEIEVFPPVGRFNTELDPANEKHYVAFAAGAGITPIISILKTALETEPKSRCTLFFGNRTPETTIFRSELNRLKNRYMDRLSVQHVFSRAETGTEFFHGRLDKAKVTQILERLLPLETIDEAFLCGPDRMIEEVSAALTGHGLEARRIHTERFTNEGQSAVRRAHEPRRTEAHAAAGALRIRLDGRVHEIAYDPSMGTVLEAAEKAGLEVPFSCRGGVCTTCRAKIEEGEAEMEVNYGLEDHEIASGFVLTCQAVPTSETLTISYDE